MSDPSIVVIDDSRMELEFVEHCYAQTGLRHPLRCFTDPADLFDYLERAARGECAMPGCILSDIRLVPLDGFQLVTKLRRLVGERTQVALFTSSRRPDDASHAERLGVELYEKPTGVQAYTQFLVELAARIAL